MDNLDILLDKENKTPLEWGVILLHKEAAEKAADELAAFHSLLSDAMKALEKYPEHEGLYTQIKEILG